MKEIRYIKILWLAFLGVLLPTSSSYAGFGSSMSGIGQTISSFMNDAGKALLGGGVIILAVVGLIMAIACVFSLFMMARR